MNFDLHISKNIEQITEHTLNCFYEGIYFDGENINDLTQVYQKVVVSITRVNELLQNKLYQDESFGNKKNNNIKLLLFNMNYLPLILYTITNNCLIKKIK